MKYVYHIKEEISHLKCTFSLPGSCTRIPYLHILEIQRKLHPKSANIFLAYERDVQITGCEQSIFNILWLRVQLAECDKIIMILLLC